jgi:hypothetical protein
MSLSTFSYIISAIELLAAVSLLASPAKTAEWFLKLKEDEVLLRLLGAFFFVICALPLAENAAIWPSVAGLIRLMAWLGGVKSLWICWWPGSFGRQVDWLLSRPALLRPWGVLALVAGALFLLAGNYLQGLGT